MRSRNEVVIFSSMGTRTFAWKEHDRRFVPCGSEFPTRQQSGFGREQTQEAAEDQTGVLGCPHRRAALWLSVRIHRACAAVCAGSGGMRDHAAFAAIIVAVHDAPM